jgi:L-ascorbate metabolism protein UlaG (beta-lactamase superfamily)
LSPGKSASVRGVQVDAVYAYNTDKFRAPGQVYHPRDDDHLGYVIELDGRRIYHAGDTDHIPEMGEVRCDVALLPVSGIYVMTADEAAGACETISAGVVVPMHYGTVAGSRDDAVRFGGLCKVPVSILPDENG